MKILLATSKAVPSGGGIASYNQELVNAFGAENEIYLLTDADETDVEGYIETFRTCPNSNSDYEYCRRLVDCINAFEYDCIINSNSAFIPVIAPFLKAKIISISHFVNGALANNAGYNAEYQNGIIALSEYGKRYIEEKFNVFDSEKVHVVYNFVKDADVYARDKVNRRPLRIVYPGGTSIKKSVDVVQQLVYRLLATDLDFEFFWLGGTRLPSARMSLLGLDSTEKLFEKDKRLHITGLISREKSIELIESANIFLLPSRGEGCPMTLLEAMRGGCIPIVSDAKHGSREIIENSGAGVIVRQGKSKELCKSIENVLRSHIDYVDIYDKAFDYLTDELSQQKWTAKMLEVLDSVIPQSKKVISMSESAFKKSSKEYAALCRCERIKDMIRSAYYRVKFDISFVKNKLGLYR